MNLLAVETSTELCSVALLRGTELFVEEALAGNRHSEMAVPMVRAVLARAGLEPRRLDGFAFGQGPGSFTGIRIACGLVQGLAFGAGRLVVGVPSLLALAESRNESHVVAALDARMGQAYVAAYRREGADWAEMIAPCLADAAGVPALPAGRWLATGSGFDRHQWLRDAYGDAISAIAEGELPRAGDVARIGARRFPRAVPAEQAAPLYLRDKVALTTEERRTRP